MVQSWDSPRTGKSISIALAFALRACVRAKLRVRDDSAVARVGLMDFPGGPSVRPSGRRGPRTLSLLLAWVFVRMFNQA